MSREEQRETALRRIRHSLDRLRYQSHTAAREDVNWGMAMGAINMANALLLIDHEEHNRLFDLNLNAALSARVDRKAKGVSTHAA